MLRLTARRFEQGERRAALDSLRDYIALEPSAAGAWLLASFHDRLGEAEEAVDALETALSVDERFVPARIDLAVRLAEAGDASTAERQFRRALDDAPYHAQAHYNYGTFVLHDGRFGEAARFFRRAVALAPGYRKAHLGLVAAHVAANDRQAALDAYAVLSRQAPRSEETATAAGLLAAVAEGDVSSTASSNGVL
jgi:Tfp pilus assembly protein PilF